MRVVVCALLVCGTAPLTAQPETRSSSTPGVDTPRLIVLGYSPATYYNRDAAASVGRALERRIAQVTLWVLSGYPVEQWVYWEADTTESFAMRDHRIVGLQMEAEYVLDVQASRSSRQVRLQGRLFATDADTLPVKVFSVTGRSLAHAADSLAVAVLRESGKVDVRRSSPLMRCMRQAGGTSRTCAAFMRVPPR